MIEGYLVLEDGTIFEGKLFGAMTDKAGEVVFTTGGVDGYQEILTDPASKGQLIVMASPCIGNYGVLDEFNQSDKVQANGLIVYEVCLEPSPQYRGKSLDEFLERNGATGIAGIDTRELILKIRKQGRMKGAIVKKGTNINGIISDLKAMPVTNPVTFVSTKEARMYNNGKEVTIAVLDLGVKKSMLKALSEEFNLIVYPYDTPYTTILSSGVKGMIISSGPGSPNNPGLSATVSNLKDLRKKLPMFGIGLGCEILAMALGAEVVPMTAGHHGCNQPVKVDGKICMTSQSHDYSISKDSMRSAKLECIQDNLNDDTVEYYRHMKLPIYGCEYDPFGNPGPSDTVNVFDEFFAKVKEVKQ